MVSLVDLNSLVKMRLDAMVAVGVKDGRITEIYAALPVRDENGNLGKTTWYGPFGKDDKRMK